MMRRSYTIVSEPVDVGYSSLLKFLFKHSTQCDIVVQASCHSSDSAQAFLDSVRPYLADDHMQSSWPGTVLGDGSMALVQAYSLEWPFIEAMTTAADGLYEWLSPDLPENPAFYRSDGTVLLGTTTHERDAFLNLTQAEHSELVEAAPQLSLTEGERI